MNFKYNEAFHHIGIEQNISYIRQRDDSEICGYVADTLYWNINRSDFLHYETYNTLSYFSLSYKRFIQYSSISSTVNRLENVQNLSKIWLNWENVDNLWEGLSSFIVGAGSGALTAVNPLAGSMLGGAVIAANSNIIEYANNVNGLANVNWGDVGLESLKGLVVGGISSGMSMALDKLGIATKILNHIDIGSLSAQNVIGSTIEGVISGSLSGIVDYTADNMTGKPNGSLYESICRGAIFGAIGGFARGVISEVEYQAQLKYGERDFINSKVNDVSSNAFDNGINELNNPNANGDIPTYGTYQLPEITVVAKSITSTSANVYINMRNINSPFIPPSPYKYYSNTLYNLLPLLKL